MVFRDAPLVVWAATVLHVIIGGLLLVSPEAGDSTGPAMIVSIFGTTLSGIALLVASCLALAAMLLRFGETFAKIGFLLPQQLLLYVAAWGGIEAIAAGSYADGVLRPYGFILTDQLPLILFAFIHTLAVLELPWRDN